MTDPVQAALWLAIAAVTVLVLSLGGTLIAAGICRWPAPLSVNLQRRRGPATQSPGIPLAANRYGDQPSASTLRYSVHQSRPATSPESSSTSLRSGR
jgi:hypothetical protein